MVLDVSSLSNEYLVRKLDTQDLSKILELQEGNPQYYQYCPPTPSIANILKDMAVLPSGKSSDDKYYLGFFAGHELVAILDLLTSHPRKDTVFIGFFMMAKSQSGKGKGSSVVEKALGELRANGYTYARLGYMKGNPQSKAFWRKCGFVETGLEVENDQGTVVILTKTL